VEVERRPDLDLLINPANGWRRLRHMSTRPDLWDEVAADAKHVEVDLECTPEQLDALTDDDADVNALFGGNRSGKTTTLAKWFFRQWMLRGGPGELMWWVAPSWKQTKIGLRKLVAGQGKKSPPVFPAELVVSFPRNQHAEQEIILIDGTKIVLGIAYGEGDGLKGDNYVAAGVDEITSIDQQVCWVIISGRMLDSGGPLGVASTPKQGHWAREDIVAHAAVSTHYRVSTLSCFDNPWINRDVLARKIEALGGVEDPIVRREFLGEWITVGAMAVPEWRPDEHMVRNEAITVTALGRLDVTADAADRHWRHEHGMRRHEPAVYVAGEDFNLNPQSAVIGQLWEDKKTGTRGLFIVDVVQTRGTIDAHAENLSRHYDPRTLRIACDSSGCVTGTAPSQGATGGMTLALVLAGYGFDARACRYWRGRPQNPGVKDSLALVNRLFRQDRIRIHRRCRPLIEALNTQQTTEDGKILKPPGTRADRRSSPLDAFRYLCEAVFGHEANPDALARNSRAYN
jgi:hypothetical protein